MITGKALITPVYQRFLPVVLLPAGVLAGYYNIERTLFSDTTTVQLSDIEVLAECITVESNNTNVQQYMAVVFRNIQAGHTPWMSSAFVSKMDYKSQFTASYGVLEKRTALDVFNTAFLTNLDFDVDNPQAPPGSTPLPLPENEPKVWTVRVGSLFSNSCTYIDINWVQQFLKTSPKAKPQTAAITETPSEFRVNLIATRMGGDGLPIYDTLRIQNKVPATLPVQIKLLVDAKTEVTINIV